jgi:hypothetical protein
MAPFDTGDKRLPAACDGWSYTPARGTLRLLRNGEEIWRREVSAAPERRVRFPGELVSLDHIESVEVRLDPS